MSILTPSSPLKIGFNGRVLALPQVRGWTRYTVELLRALSALGDIQLVLFTQEDLQPEHLTGINAKVVKFAAARETLWNDWLLPRMIRSEGVALFHAPADRGLPLASPCPLVVTVHGSYERAHWRSLFPSWKQKTWYWKNEAVNYFADAVLTVSDCARSDLIKARVAPAARIHTVYLASSDGFGARPADNDGAVLDNHGVREPYVLYVGGYNSWKNVSTLVHAFDGSGLTGWQLVIAAEHRFGYELLRAEWQGLRCFERLRLIEPSPEQVPALYRHAELFVNPSLWESFSFQLVEAMASGTPLLCSDHPVMREVTAGAAIFFDPLNVPALAALISRCAQDDALRETLRAAGLERVRAFSWRKTALETMRVYRDVLSRS